MYIYPLLGRVYMFIQLILIYFTFCSEFFLTMNINTFSFNYKDIGIDIH